MWQYVIAPLLMGMAFYTIVNNLSHRKDTQDSIDLFKELQKERQQNDRQLLRSSQRVLSNRMLDANMTQSNMYDSVFQGNWNNLPNFSGSQFNYFGDDHGIILFGMSFKDPNYDEIDFLLLDPQYDDEKKVYIQLENLNSCLQTNITWSCQTNISVKEYYKRSKQSESTVAVNFSMNIVQIDPTQPLTQSNSKFFVTITNQANASETIGLTADLTVQSGDFTVQFLLYNLFVSVFGLQQLYSVMALTNFIQRTNEVISTKLSMLTIGFITVFDSYVSLGHLYMALEYSNYFYYFILPTLIYFVMTTIVDMKLLIIVWKNRCYVNYTTPAEIRKGFVLFYVKFYVALIAFFTLTYFFYLYNEYVLLWPLFIVPQIVHNFMKGNSPLFLYNYAFGMIFSRFIIPFYFRTCPYNIRNLAPSLSFSITWPALFVFFILVMFLQNKIGPRFFVPRRFKGGYDYYKSYYSNEPVMEEDCPICMSKLKEEPEDEIDDSDQENQQRNSSGASAAEMEGIDASNNAINNEKLVKKKKIIQTSCNHKYHISCFKSWINIKLECPSCRNPLKPLID